jgi:hypothetical protein
VLNVPFRLTAMWRSNGSVAHEGFMVVLEIVDRRLNLNEFEQVGVDGTGFGRGHTIAQRLIASQGANFQQLCRPRRRPLGRLMRRAARYHADR